MAHRRVEQAFPQQSDETPREGRSRFDLATDRRRCRGFWLVGSSAVILCVLRVRDTKASERIQTHAAS